jgi:16S rRNA (adenine1518-N6/adenine1519-N6)-dimethyltransferase
LHRRRPFHSITSIVALTTASKQARTISSASAKADASTELVVTGKRSAMPLKAKLGQNFLVDPGAAAAIAGALGNVGDKTVLEIGPGKGVITGHLAGRARRLIAVELDASLAAALRERYRGTPSVEIVEGDILSVNLASLIAPGETVEVIGNLPYYITSDILLYLFARHASITRAVVMMQREVADRVAASPGTRDYGLLSATAQLHARVERLLTLPPSAFSPPPEVHSTVLRLTMRPQWLELGVDPDGFVSFLKQCFAQKRKTLANNLRAAGYEPAQIMAALDRAKLDPQARAEAIPLVASATVYKNLSGTP